MKQVFNYFILVFIAFTVFSCVNSSMYNTSIGEPAEVKYVKPDEDDSGYKHIDLEESKKVSEEAKFTVVKSTMRDTVVNETRNYIKNTIDEATKDSLLFALIKDKTRTQEEKDEELENFIKSHNRELIKYDTVITSKEKYDTVFIKKEDVVLNSDSTSIVQQEIKDKIAELQKQLENFENAESKEEKKAIKEEIELTSWEIRKLGEEDGKMHKDIMPLLAPLSFYGAAFIAASDPTYTITESAPNLFVVGFSLGIYHLFAKPRVNWSSLNTPNGREYKNDPEYRKGYLKTAKSKQRVKALFALIPYAVTLTALAFIVILFLALI